MGQGLVILTHSEPGVPNPSAPWEPVEPVTTSDTLGAAVSGVDQRLVGTKADDGQVIVSSDRSAICTVPKIAYAVGDTLSIDGKPVHVISVEKLPAAGITSAVKFTIRN